MPHVYGSPEKTQKKKADSLLPAAAPRTQYRVYEPQLRPLAQTPLAGTGAMQPHDASGNGNHNGSTDDPKTSPAKAVEKRARRRPRGNTFISPQHLPATTDNNNIFIVITISTP